MSSMHKIHVTDLIALVLLIVGGVNWLLIGLFNWDLVAAIFGPVSWVLTRFTYAIVGVAAIYALVRVPAMAHYRVEPHEHERLASQP